MSKWIPVNKRLPEKDGNYLCTKVFHPRPDSEIYFVNAGIFQDGHFDDFVTAWQELPEPYRGDEDGQMDSGY